MMQRLAMMRAGMVPGGQPNMAGMMPPSMNPGMMPPSMNPGAAPTVPVNPGTTKPTAPTPLVPGTNPATSPIGKTPSNGTFGLARFLGQ
jgi:hypothetical protein